jgi:type I restriction enzyme S subunit
MSRWKKKKLSEFCEFSNGLWTGKKPPFQKVGVIRNTNFTKDCRLDDSDIVYLDVEQSQFQKRKLKYGDIILEKSGGGPKQPVGRVVIFDKTEGDFSFSNFTSVIRIKNQAEVDFNFLHRYLVYEYVSGATEKMQSHSTGIRNLKFDEYKEIEIPLPPLPEQQRIVSILDECFAAIDKAKANAEQNLKNAKELFESYLQGVFENGNWETKTIEVVCNEIFAGGDAPKNNFSLEPNEKHNIPIYANAVKDRGLYGYTDFARVTKPCVTIAARGSGTGHTELREVSFLPIVRLIVCIPDTNLISSEFLKYTIDNLVIQRSGSAIPQLTIPMIKDYKIPVPTIEEQKKIIEKAEILKEQKENLENVYLKKIEGLDELKKSILQKAFAGELRGGEPAEPKSAKIAQTT